MSAQRPDGLKFTNSHAACHSGFFFLRTPVTVNGQPAEIGYATESELMLSCCNSQISIPLSSIAAGLGPILRSYGVSAVTNYYYEDTVPLFQVDFSDEDKLKRFLQAREEIQTETASLLYGMLSNAQKRANSDCTLQHVDVQTELFLAIPDVVKKEVQLMNVNLENYSECMALWKKSEVFNLTSTFRVYHNPSWNPDRLKFTNSHAVCHSSFFFLRTPVTANGQPAEIGYAFSAKSELMLSCCNSQISIPLSSIAAELGLILRSYGVSSVTNYYYEDTVPLFQVDFSDEDKLKRFLQAGEKVQTETASLLSGMLSKAQKRANSNCTLQRVDVQTELFLVKPDVVKKEAQLMKVNLENYFECMALWKENEVFNLTSTFRVYRDRTNPGWNPGELTIKALITELHEVVNWFILGIYLDIPVSELQKIKYDHREIDACRNAMFLKWMHNADIDPTWSAVVRALVGIGMKSLARKLALKYSVALLTDAETEALHELQYFKQQAQLQSAIQELRKEEEETHTKFARIEESLEKSTKEKEVAEREYSDDKHKLFLAQTRVKKLTLEKKEISQRLEMEERELQSLQQLQRIEQENEALKASIESKNIEIRKLQEELEKVKNELQSTRDEAVTQREKLHQREIELTEKTTRVQELERARADLRADLDRERIRVDKFLMRFAGAGGHGDVATGTTSVSHEGISSEVEVAQPMKPFEIYVHDARGNLHTLAIPSSDPENYSIAELGRLFEEQTGQRLDEHQFQFRGEEIGHGRQLKHYGIKAHDTLHVVKTGLVVHITNPQVDVCFMVDCTASMGKWIEAVKNHVKQLRDRLDADYKGCDIRFAFVRYTDYPASTWVDLITSWFQRQTTWIDFTKSQSAFHDFVGAITADWNGVDFPEDIMGGLKAVFVSLSWRSSATKVLIHIADAPCHGKQYHDFSDRYPDGDPAEISPVEMMEQVVQNDVQYWFGYINKASTDKMVSIFNDSVQNLSDNRMMIRQFNAVKPAEIGEAVHKSITASIFASEAAKRGRSCNS